MSGKAARGLGKSRQSFHFLERPKKASAAQLILTFVFVSKVAFYPSFVYLPFKSRRPKRKKEVVC